MNGKELGGLGSPKVEIKTPEQQIAHYLRGYVGRVLGDERFTGDLSLEDRKKLMSRIKEEFVDTIDFVIKENRRTKEVSEKIKEIIRIVENQPDWNPGNVTELVNELLLFIGEPPVPIKEQRMSPVKKLTDYDIDPRKIEKGRTMANTNVTDPSGLSRIMDIIKEKH